MITTLNAFSFHIVNIKLNVQAFKISAHTSIVFSTRKRIARGTDPKADRISNIIQIIIMHHDFLQLLTHKRHPFIFIIKISKSLQKYKTHILRHGTCNITFVGDYETQLLLSHKMALWPHYLRP